MVSTGNLWEDTIDRIGRWVDFKGSYKTMDKDYMESVWWAFKTLYEKGKIYEGERVLMYDTKWATPLSKAEVTMDAGAYQVVTDPSVYVKFRRKTAKDSLKFTPELTELVLSGEKYVTYRREPKNLQVGDTVELLTRFDDANVKHFGYAKVTKIRTLALKNIPIDEPGHETFTSKDDQLNAYKEYYGNDVTEDTPITIYDFKLSKQELKNSYLLAWTTTPWTLPGNTALAVNSEVEYAEVELDGEYYILAKDMLEKVLVSEKRQPLEYNVVRTMKGKELVGESYEPLFEDRGQNAHKVWAADYVTTESGTGIVHLAPAYGEEDFELAKKEGIPVVHVLDEYGKYTEGEWQGLDVWETNKTIAKALKERGVVWKIDYIQHEYPHNLRNGNRLMYRAHPSWFMDIDGQRTEMLEQNTENVNWFPSHIKHGRFEKTVLQAPDWNLSRDRFWATAMPVWKGVDKDGKEHVKVVGSYAELKELSGIELDDYHRPWVDDITFTIDGVEYKRIDKVLDCWFESGSMPFAQFHYPFENVEKFERNFPGDFIVEYVGQVRAWFYYVHAVNVGLFGKNAFKNVIVTGNLMGNDGYKLSKSRGNFTDPGEIMDKYSADAWRLFLLMSPVLNGEDAALLDKDVSDVARKLSMIWNMYDFFTMYAEVDGWEWNGDTTDPSEELTNPLDQWIVSRVHQLNHDVQKYMDAYDLPNATKPILPFIEDASNWYVRRSRRRFWKTESTSDKNDAYKTLHYVLVHLAQIIAPFTPFLAEELYQKLTGGESVHLLDWPVAGRVNELVLKDMEAVREYVNQGLSIRAKEKLKVRQPLASVTVPTLGEFVNFEDILSEELNVKTVLSGAELQFDLVVTPELKREGLMREVIRAVQSARKQAGLNVDDKIVLSLQTDNEQLQRAIDEHQQTIIAETLAAKIDDQTHDYSSDVTIETAQLKLSLKKHSSVDV